MFNKFSSIGRRFFTSYRKRQLYNIKNRTEMVSAVIDQQNYLPFRPLDSGERPNWTSPIQKVKESIGRLRNFPVTTQYNEFKMNWKESFNEEYNEGKVMEELFKQYQTYCNAIATGNIGQLLDIATINIYKLAKESISQRPTFTSKRPLVLHWCVHKVLSLPYISNAICSTLGDHVRGLIGGVSVKFHTQQEIYGMIGNNLGIEEDRVSLVGPIEVQDHIVFVRDFTAPFRGWKIAGISEAVTEYYTSPKEFKEYATANKGN